MVRMSMAKEWHGNKEEIYIYNIVAVCHAAERFGYVHRTCYRLDDTLTLSRQLKYSTLRKLQDSWIMDHRLQVNLVPIIFDA